MSIIDWLVLAGTISAIVGYGLWKTRGTKSVESYVHGGNTLSWPTIGLSIMATQASAITFLSTPGQAFDDGMRFVQFYFGLPLAMIVISAVFVPIYYRLKILTAYEYLEHRFDVRVRFLGAVLFLLGRGLAAGVTLYAPSIILSSMLGLPVSWLVFGIGIIVILYTVSGGTQAVTQTQRQQMIVILSGLAVAAVVLVMRLPEGVGVPAAARLAGALDHMNVVTFNVDPDSRYTLWAGLTGGFFLQLSYFGTDQSQVQRYLSGKSITEIRLGLLFNGMFKVPMQFVILSIGVLMFVFYLFNQPPLFFNKAAREQAMETPYAAQLSEIQTKYDAAFAEEQRAARAFLTDDEAKGQLRAAAAEVKALRSSAQELILKAVPGTSKKDADYVFLTFVTEHLPRGLIGLLIAVILCAAMSSIAGELSALGATTSVDLYQRFRKRRDGQTVANDVRASKLFTAMWGVIVISFGAFASLVDNLIEAVNIMGSIFYGTILGLFVVGFFLKRVSATPVFIAALLAEGTVVTLFLTTKLGYLWFNVIGCAIVVVMSLLLQPIVGGPAREAAAVTPRT